LSRLLKPELKALPIVRFEEFDLGKVFDLVVAECKFRRRGLVEVEEAATLWEDGI
jgi:hypothetical protein